jgi:hypothetical protein
MANELSVTHTVGKNVYVIVLDPNGQIRDVVNGNFETISDAASDDYDIGLNEADGTGIYLGNEPPGLNADTVYSTIFYERQGGTAVLSVDIPVAVGKLHDDVSSGSIAVDVAEDVWGALVGNHQLQGSFGALLQEIRNVVTDTNNKVPDDFVAQMSSILSSVDEELNANEVNNIVEAVWNALRTNFTSEGSFGQGVIVEALNQQAKLDVTSAVPSSDCPSIEQITEAVRSLLGDGDGGGNGGGNGGEEPPSPSISTGVSTGRRITTGSSPA